MLGRGERAARRSFCVCECVPECACEQGGQLRDPCPHRRCDCGGSPVGGMAATGDRQPLLGSANPPPGQPLLGSTNRLPFPGVAVGTRTACALRCGCGCQGSDHEPLRERSQSGERGSPTPALAQRLWRWLLALSPLLRRHMRSAFFRNSVFSFTEGLKRKTAWAWRALRPSGRTRGRASTAGLGPRCRAAAGQARGLCSAPPTLVQL